MTIHATEFEFRHRFWFIAGIFSVAFLCYVLDRTNVSVALSKMICAAGKPGTWGGMAVCIRSFFIFGAALTVAAALVRTWATAYLHSSIVHDGRLHADRLVADGPYRRLRNPLYLGTVLVAAGTGFLASRAGIVMLVGGMVLFTYRLILREEAGLLASQGESYRRYLQRVPRFLPALKPAIPSAGSKPDWVDGFAGELFIWGCAGGMILFAATEKLAFYWIPLITGFLLTALRNSRRRRAAEKPASR